jgi:hypothetical protein
MKLTTVIAAVFVGSVAALPQTTSSSASATPTAAPSAPAGGSAPSYGACSTSPYSGALCCATDVLGVADLDCHTRKSFHLTSFTCHSRVPVADGLASANKQRPVFPPAPPTSAPYAPPWDSVLVAASFLLYVKPECDTLHQSDELMLTKSSVPQAQQGALCQTPAGVQG